MIGTGNKKNESQKHYAKWKIPDSKDATYCVIPFIRHSETGKTIRREIRSMAPRSWV